MQADTERLLRAYLERINEDEAMRGPVQELLRQSLDLAAFPTDLTRLLSLTPPIYRGEGQTSDKRRFEFQRTPTVFPTGRIAFAAAGATDITKATGFGGVANTNAIECIIRDARRWFLLGGTISISAAAVIIIREAGGARIAWATVAAAAVTGQPINIPANGFLVDVDMKKSLEIFSSAAVNVDFNLWVAEDADTTGRGGV